MTEHLPECWAKDPSDPPAWCICDELRACEQRVREDERSSNFTPDDHADGMTESYHRGFDDARWIAAKEALEGVQHENCHCEARVLREAQLRVAALRDPWPTSAPGTIKRSDAIAAIKSGGMPL